MTGTGPFSPINRLVAHGSAGCTIDGMARACYELHKQLGIEVQFVHNDRRYQATLDVINMPPEPRQAEHRED